MFMTAVERNRSESPEIRELMFMAEWMLESGKTSNDWANLPISDTKLISAFLSARQVRDANLIAMTIGGIFGGGKQ